MPAVFASLLVVSAFVAGPLDARLGVSGQYGGSTRQSSLSLFEHGERYGDHFTVYAQIRSVSPEGHIYLQQASDLGLSTSRLFAISQATTVTGVALGAVARPTVAPTKHVTRGERTWLFWLMEGSPAPSLLVAAGNSIGAATETLILDTRLLPAEIRSALPEVPDEVRRQARVSSLPSYLLEWMLYVLLVLVGSCFVPRSVPRYARPAFALLVAFCLVGIGAVLRLPGLAALVPPFASAILVRRYAFDSWRVWRRSDVEPVALFSAGLLILLLHTHLASHVVVSLDSFAYLIGGHELAQGRLSLGGFNLKQGAFLQGLYALGFSIGVDILVAPGVVALFAASVLLAAFGWTQARGWDKRLLVIALAAVPWVHVQTLSLARYVNSHTILAALLLALAMSIYWATTSTGNQHRELAALLVPLAAAPVLLRAEGVLLVALLLLGASRVLVRPLGVAWTAAGAMTVLWGALLLLEAIGVGSEPPRLLYAYLALGIALILLPLVAMRAQRLWRAMPTVTLTALWGFTLLLTTGITGRSSQFVSAAVINLGEGRGRWGIFAPLVLLLALVAVALRPKSGGGSADGSARALLIGFIPISLVSKLGDGVFIGGGSIIDLLVSASGGGRVGWGDSVNRMWMHAVLMVLFLTLIRFAGQGQPSGAPLGASDLRATSRSR